ncbi:MAG: PP0621 family protein [Burkholderiales bacterium]
MLRVVLLLAGVAALVWLVRRAFDPAADRPTEERADTRAGPPGGDALVRCAHCGVHVPRAEAASKDGLHYCSEDHARLGVGEERP